MELKEFKEGIAFLQKLTNQRRAEPEPFLFQIGKDGKISLVVGDERGTYIWRTGIDAKHSPLREGVASKPLVQATKVLKGKLTVSLSTDGKTMAVETSNGGAISVPFVDAPETLLRPGVSTNGGGTFRIDDVAGLAARIAAVSGEERGWDYVQLEGENLLATDSIQMFRMLLPHFKQAKPVAFRATFLNALSGARANGEARVSDSGIRIVAGNYEAFTGFVEPRNVPDMVARTYPVGRTIENMAVMDRKVLIGSLKAVDQSVSMSVFKTMVNVSDAKGQQVTLSARSSRGESSIKFLGPRMLEILGSLSGKDVIIEWMNDPRQPLHIQDAGRQAETFLLAPVWKAM